MKTLTLNYVENSFLCLGTNNDSSISETFYPANVVNESVLMLSSLIITWHGLLFLFWYTVHGHELLNFVLNVQRTILHLLLETKPYKHFICHVLIYIAFYQACSGVDRTWKYTLFYRLFKSRFFIIDFRKLFQKLKYYSIVRSNIILFI